MVCGLRKVEKFQLFYPFPSHILPTIAIVRPQDLEQSESCQECHNGNVCKGFQVETKYLDCRPEILCEYWNFVHKKCSLYVYYMHGKAELRLWKLD